MISIATKESQTVVDLIAKYVFVKEPKSGQCKIRNEPPSIIAGGKWKTPSR
jgi:hypothetical protein